MSDSCSGPSSRLPTWWRRWRSPASSGCRAGFLVILEGEGLANDAHRADPVPLRGGGDFDRDVFTAEGDRHLSAVFVVAELLFGAAIGWLSLRMRHRARDPQVEITLSLLTPLYRLLDPAPFRRLRRDRPQVACGLYMSWNGPLLISSATRLQGIFFWDLVIYLIEGLLFLLTGFQMRSLFEKSKAFPLDDILFATALVASSSSSRASPGSIPRPICRAS
jgi:CPA1 family monovalent cation:H+ antiporter